MSGSGSENKMTDKHNGVTPQRDCLGKSDDGEAVKEDLEFMKMGRERRHSEKVFCLQCYYWTLGCVYSPMSPL